MGHQTGRASQRYHDDLEQERIKFEIRVKGRRLVSTDELAEARWILEAAAQAGEGAEIVDAATGLKMSVPTSFPAYMSLPDGRSALVFDAAGYNAMTAQGGIYGSSTPSTTTRSGAATLTIAEIALNDQQTDTLPAGARSRGKIR